MADQNSRILDFIEKLLLIAERVGDEIRNPQRYVGSDFDTGKEVGFCCRELDELGCSWSVQNKALNYINNADTSKVWDELHRRQHRAIAEEIVAAA